MEKGISVNFERMNKIVHLALGDMLITVRPGMTRLDLNEFVNKYGYQFPIDPKIDGEIIHHEQKLKSRHLPFTYEENRLDDNSQFNLLS